MLTGTLSPVSNKADWSESVELTDEETGEAIDLSDVDEITVSVRRSSDCVPSLTATMSGGVSVIQAGIFEFSFTASQMGALCPTTYEVGCTLEKDDQTIQLIIGTVQVLDGIVS